MHQQILRLWKLTKVTIKPTEFIDSYFFYHVFKCWDNAQLQREAIYRNLSKQLKNTSEQKTQIAWTKPQISWTSWFQIK